MQIRLVDGNAREGGAQGVHNAKPSAPSEGADSRGSSPARKRHFDFPELGPKRRGDNDDSDADSQCALDTAPLRQ